MTKKHTQKRVGVEDSQIRKSGQCKSPQKGTESMEHSGDQKYSTEGFQ